MNAMPFGPFTIRSRYGAINTSCASPLKPMMCPHGPRSSPMLCSCAPGTSDGPITYASSGSSGEITSPPSRGSTPPPCAGTVPRS